MARTKRSRRSYGAGEWGRNRVRVFPDPKTGLYQLEWRENGRRLTRSLGHRDWVKAKKQADEAAAGFAVHEPNGKAEAEPEPLTLGSLFEIYGEEVTPTKGKRTRERDKVATAMFLDFFGRDRMCPSGSPTWMGLPVCEEAERTGYDRDAFGSAYSSLEDEIIKGLPKSGGQVYTPYSCKLFDIRADGTAATDIEHIVALAEAYDSGLPESQFRTFAGDLVNLTIADPAVNRNEKSDRDAGEWRPSRNTGWFAAKVIAVKQKYDLSVNPAERDALASMLASDSSRTVTCN